MFIFLLKGLIIGFTIAAPVGPIGILCIQRSLREGFKVGLLTGMGAALAHGLYGLIAGFSLTAISSLLVSHQFWICLSGGLFLIYLGIKLLITRPGEQSTIENTVRSPWQTCVSTFLLTLANPMTILSFVAVFAGLKLGNINTNDLYEILLVAGIILGSATWWFCLSSSVAFFLRHRISPESMQIINWLSGITMLVFGIFVLI